MNGFRNFVIVALFCVALGFWLSNGPVACQPPDVGDCAYDANIHQYDCPEENK